MTSSSTPRIREQAATTPSTLAALTTFRVGGPVTDVVDATSEAELVAAVRDADDAGTPLLVLGGGSNLLAADAPFPGRVVRDGRRGLRLEDSAACFGTSVVVPAGQPWDDVVATAVAEGWRGVEALSGIPGSTGATPVQNVGAYGQEVGETLASVRVFDRLTQRTRTLAVSELGLGYRTSVLKRSLSHPDAGGGRTWGPTGRYVVLEVGFQLAQGSSSMPVRYAELAQALDVDLGETAPAERVREAVLDLRRGKGMVLDAVDPDTWSAGSFFTNPVLPAEEADSLLPPDAPRFPAGHGRVKTSAAWLISRAGFERGFGDPQRAALSSKHVLALTNRGEASAADLLELARTVRDGVRQRFGVELVPEPVLVGLEL